MSKFIVHLDQSKVHSGAPPGQQTNLSGSTFEVDRDGVLTLYREDGKTVAVFAVFAWVWMEVKDEPFPGLSQFMEDTE